MDQELFFARQNCSDMVVYKRSFEDTIRCQLIDQDKPYSDIEVPHGYHYSYAPADQTSLIPIDQGLVRAHHCTLSNSVADTNSH